MLTVHHLEKSRSHRILWLLEELGVPYELKTYKRDPATMLAPPELAKIHPLGKAPVVTDGDAVLAESGAMLEYLAERYGEGKWTPPAGTPEHQRCRYFLHYAEGSLMPILLVKLIASQLRSKKIPFLVRPIARGISAQIDRSYTDPNLDRHLAFLESELAERTWLCGGDQPTIADVQMSYPTEAAVARAGRTTKHLARYLDRMRARPAYQRALEKGGPIMLD